MASSLDHYPINISETAQTAQTTQTERSQIFQQDDQIPEMRVHPKFFKKMSLLKSHMNEQNCTILLFALIGIALAILIFGIIPMPIGYFVYMFLYPDANIMMFSVFTWAVGFLSIMIFTSLPTGCLCCLCCFASS